MGVILYKLLTGTTPIERGESAAAQVYFALPGQFARRLRTSAARQ